jgi:hypothetical protein
MELVNQLGWLLGKLLKRMARSISVRGSTGVAANKRTLAPAILGQCFKTKLCPNWPTTTHSFIEVSKNPAVSSAEIPRVTRVPVSLKK